METTKICTKCNIQKSTKEFYKRSDTKDGLRSHCKSCLKEKFDSEKEYIYIKRKESYELRKDYLNKKRRKHRQDNPELYKEIESKRSFNKDRKKYKREYSKNYRKTEKGKLIDKNKNHRRRSVKKDGDVTTSQLQDLIINSKNCYWCNIKINKDYHMDHYIPLSKGGKHTISNLVITCSTCNLKKHAKDPLEFAQENGRLL